MTDPKTVRFVHVDVWLDEGPRHYDDKNENYARWWLEQARFPAWKKGLYHEFMKQRCLFCTYRGSRYRVTGASRMGDIWLAEDHTREAGYDLRVNVMECTEWSENP